MLYCSKKDADYSVNHPIGGPDEINRKDSRSPHDTGLYKMRNIVEPFFCIMQDMRRLATRFEKLSRNFLAMIHIFAIRLWIN